MYARVTTYQCDPARLDEMGDRIEELKAQVKAVAGLVAVYTAWRDDGNGVTTAIYESQAAAEAAVPQVQAIWADLADFLTGPPNAEGYDNVEHLTA